VKVSWLAAAFVLAIPWVGHAQQMNMNAEESRSAAPYHPGLGELMTAYVQPRHIKLGLAGAAGNWPYAAYELGELRETFDDVGKLVPKHGNLMIAPALASTVKPPMAALDKAIKAKAKEFSDNEYKRYMTSSLQAGSATKTKKVKAA